MEENREKNIVMTKRVGRKRKPRTDDNDVKRWSDLPNELLESIKKRLFYIDQCKLSAVCKSWNSIEEEEERNIIPQSKQMPWLLVFDETDSCKLVDSMYKKEYTINMKSIKKKMKVSSFENMRVHESKYGWLLISFLNRNTATNTLFLYSPFIGEENNNNYIELPILNVNICLASFTSNPLDDDCTVVTLNTSSQMNAILVNTYGRGQSSWSRQIFKCEFAYWEVKRWMYFEGMFYYTTYLGKVGAFDLAREEWNVFPSSPLKQRELSVGTLYMVKSNEELFLINEDSLSKRNEGWFCSRHHICRLDLLSMVWENLSSIGDRVLFIGNGYNCVLNSSVLKLNGERKGISDTIYYCSGRELKYCSVHDFLTRDRNYGHPHPRQHCIRHYGPIATKKRCKKLLIDPPASSSSLVLHRASVNS